MRHHGDEIGFKLFDLLEQFVLLNVLPAFAVFHDEAIRDEKVVAEEDGQKRVGEVDPDVEYGEEKGAEEGNCEQGRANDY